MLSEQAIEKWLDDKGLLEGYELHKIAAGDESSLQQIMRDGIVCCRTVNCVIPMKISHIKADKTEADYQDNYGFFAQALTNLGLSPLCRCEDVLEAIEQVQECLTTLIRYADSHGAKYWDPSMGPEVIGITGKSLTVIATYNYEACNMDELSFTKGDIITVTQMVDGGWWEGELNQEVGWFPSNFVKEFGMLDTGHETKRVSVNEGETSNDYQYYNTVVSDIVESETAYLREITHLTDTLLSNVRKSNRLKSDDLEILCRYTLDLKVLHKQLLQSLTSQMSKPVLKQQVGGVFLQIGQRLKELYGNFCSNHPRAAHVITSNSAALEAYNINVIELTQHLCKPFKRVERYPALLRELEYHIETVHQDFSHISDSINMYRTLVTYLSDVRKKKESELEIMKSDIIDWKGQPIHKLGNLLLFSSVWYSNPQGVKSERYFLLFPSQLVILSVDTPYRFIDKLSTDTLKISPMETAEEESDYEDPAVTSFYVHQGDALYGSVNVHSLREKDRWCEIAATMIREKQFAKPPAVPTTAPPSLYPTQPIVYLPQPKPWSVKLLRPSPPVKLAKEACVTSPKLRHRLIGSSKSGKPAGKAVSVVEEHSYGEVLNVIDAYCKITPSRPYSERTCV